MPPSPIPPKPPSSMTKPGFWSTIRVKSDRPTAFNYAVGSTKGLPQTGNNPQEHAGINAQDALTQVRNLADLYKYGGTLGRDVTNVRTGGTGRTSTRTGAVGGALAPDINPFGPAYDAILAALKTHGAQNLADIAALRDQVAKYYDQATQDLYQQYNGSREGLNNQANDLGVNPADIYKDYDASLRQIQEQSDQSKAQDQAWFDKQQALRSSSLASLYEGLTQQQQLAMANWSIAQAQRATALAKGSKGGKGKGGGGSSSGGKITTKATQTDTVSDPNYQAVMDALNGNPTAQALVQHADIATGANPVQKQLQAEYDALVKSLQQQAKQKPITAFKINSKAPSWKDAMNAVRKKGAYTSAIPASSVLGGSQGIPKSKQTVTTSSSKKS